MVERAITILTHRIHQLPILILMPHSRCNCRCVMCDIWKANQNKKEISYDELNRHISQFKKWKVREILLSGGEPLMHSDLWKLCKLLKENKIKISLLSTGLLLKKNAQNVVKYCDEVIVSLDGSKEIHNQIRNIPQAFEKLEEGVKELKEIKPDFRVTARCVLQRLNYFDLENIIDTARDIGFNQISFLAADVSSIAFNRELPWDEDHKNKIVLTKEECTMFEQIVERSFLSRRTEYENGFIAESPDKMRKIVRHCKALYQLAEYASPPCNAPWVSVVIESNGDVMPCFFHKPYGNIYDHSIDEILNSQQAIEFRRRLDVKNNPICKKCVCSLKLGLTQMN
jgi:MoaA/NifB/PqqE/SkfB family radical SAM enzyme